MLDQLVNIRGFNLIITPISLTPIRFINTVVFKHIFLYNLFVIFSIFLLIKFLGGYFVKCEHTILYINICFKFITPNSMTKIWHFGNYMTKKEKLLWLKYDQEIWPFSHSKKSIMTSNMTKKSYFWPLVLKVIFHSIY
jgi:competence protein ComGF